MQNINNESNYANVTTPEPFTSLKQIFLECCIAQLYVEYASK